MKKLAVSIFVLIFSFMMVWEVPYRHAEAALPVAVIPAFLVPGVACALIAGGVTFATVESAEIAARWWWSEAGQQQRDDISASISDAVEGTFLLSSSLWDSIRSFLQANFVLGAATVTATYVIADSEGVPGEVVGDLTSAAGVSSALLQFYIDDVFYRIALSSGTAVAYSAGGVSIKAQHSGASGIRLIWHPSSSTSLLSQYWNGTSWVNLVGYGSASLMRSNRDFDYIGASELTESTYAGTNDVGERRYISPVSTAEVVSKSPTDVIVQTPDPSLDIPADPTGLIAVPGDGSISLDWDAVPGARYYDVYVAGVLIATGILSTNYLIGNLTNDLQYDVGVRAVNDVGVSDIASVVAVPLAVPIGAISGGGIDFTPLRVAGNMFTNKFPFSLPWDLLRSFQAISVPSQQPDFTFSVPDTNILRGMRFTVDLSIFQSIVNVSRLLEVLIFDIGLIFLTRKLLGGDV